MTDAEFTRKLLLEARQQRTANRMAGIHPRMRLLAEMHRAEVRAIEKRAHLRKLERQSMFQALRTVYRIRDLAAGRV